MNLAELVEYFEEYPDLNGEQQRIIEAMQKKHGEAWLGNINLYKATRRNPPIWKWDGWSVHTFGAAFVIPQFDAELERLILERDNTPWTGTAQDAPLVSAIIDQVYELGGQCLVWR